MTVQSEPTPEISDFKPDIRKIPMPLFNIPMPCFNMPMPTPTSETILRIDGFIPEKKKKKNKPAAAAAAELDPDDLWTLFEGRKVEKCVRTIEGCPPGVMRTFLREVASILLAREDRTGSATYIGGCLSPEARNMLSNRKMKLAYVLHCYSEDFSLAKQGQDVLATYMHDDNKTKWNLCYEVHMSL
eukprot:TRINITY_DN632_c1_g1_i1.p1 TRINITY_DN632_c1_g1~~TRINITY_DN632_c1_g1_i1.p1  ORF type:complete len:186 (-),score=21.55 TRINITY_DN632_c1_g1_i1:495-1052(-)